MEINHDAKIKFFLVMPFMDGMTDSEGMMTHAQFPNTEYCEIWFAREAAESSVLKKQKADPEATYIILESTTFTAKHEHINEYCLADTVQW